MNRCGGPRDVSAVLLTGGMEALAGVLDDDVVRFLGEFMRDAKTVRRDDPAD